MRCCAVMWCAELRDMLLGTPGMADTLVHGFLSR